MIVGQRPAPDRGSRKEKEEDKGGEDGRKETFLPVETEKTENFVALGL